MNLQYFQNSNQKYLFFQFNHIYIYIYIYIYNYIYYFIFHNICIIKSSYGFSNRRGINEEMILAEVLNFISYNFQL